MEEIHILNGDALKLNFPDSLKGILIIARECMIEGPVEGQSINDVLNTRKIFFDTIGISNEEYQLKVILEFLKLSQITPTQNLEINLWFEDDLFCQTNMWFVLKMIDDYNLSAKVYIVRPRTLLEYGFSLLDQNGLIEAYNSRIQILPDVFNLLSQLWKFYQRKDHGKMIDIAKASGPDYAFLIPAIIADKEKQSSGIQPGRPEKTLRRLLATHGKENFSSIFRSFSKIESIYGYGDDQVKRLLDSIKLDD